MENETNNVNQDNVQSNIPEVFSSNPQTGNEPVEAVDSEQLVNMEVDVNKTVEVNTQAENVVESQVIPETGVEPVSVESTETVTPVEPVVETQVIPETGNEPVSVEPTETITPVEPVVETQIIPETGSEPVNVQPVEPNKKSNKGLVTIIVIILLALVGVGIYFFLNKDNKDKEQSGDKSNSNVISNSNIESNSNSSTTKKTSSVECKNGIYKKDNEKIVVYCNKNNESLSYSYINVDDYSYQNSINFRRAYFDGSKARDFDEYLWFENGKLNYKDDKGKELVLEKESDFTAEDFFEYNYSGIVASSNGTVGGLYKKENAIIVIYPTPTGKLALYYAYAKDGKIEPDFEEFLDGHGLSSTGNQTNAVFALTKNSDGTFSYVRESLFDEKTELKISVSNSNTNLVTKVEVDKDNYLENFAGTYTKVKNLTAEDIVENNFE